MFGGKKITPRDDHTRGRVADVSELGHGALDTLGCVLRTMGDLSFPIAADSDGELFKGLCEQFACHVENGASVPTHDIPQTADGARQWADVRRFYIDRRSNEKDFVNNILEDYRDIVQDLMLGLKNIGQRELEAETGVREHLGHVESAVQSGDLTKIKAAVSDTIENVSGIFSAQKEEYELQIRDLNGRLSGMREDLVQAQEKMQRDSLTETFNRGAFDQEIVRALKMHFILGQPVTLALIDLDGFKEVNDNLGHTAGDEVLRKVGELLARAFIRKSDFVARYGGDEFAVILTDTAAVNVAPLLDRFMQQVRLVEIDAGGEPINVSCSIGFTEVTNDDTTKSVVERADKALYEAKGAGRNCHRFVE